jgi:RecQ-mediated genome instability protein 1
MLVPEAFEVLGGLVEELEAAHQRLVDEINKPPRGKRSLKTQLFTPLTVAMLTI